MKKTIFTISAMILMTTIGTAQQTKMDTRDLTHYGIKFGVNASSTYDGVGAAFDASHKLGIAFGATLALPVSTLFGFQSELLLSEKGFKATGTLSGNPYEVKRTSTYLDMPLYFTVKPSTALTFLVGTQYSFLVEHSDKFTQSPQSAQQKVVFQNDRPNKGSFGVGAGIDVNVKSFVFSGRATWDLTSNRLDVSEVVTPRYKNVWYQFTLGYRWH